MLSASHGRPFRRIAGLFAFLVAALSVRLVEAQSDARPTPTVTIPAEATVESLYVDFLHYARMGRFSAADAYGKALLAHPDLNPVKLLEVADRDRKSLDTLLILIKNAAVGDTAAAVLEVLEKGEQARRQDPERIRYNIDELLVGNPQQEFFAIRHLTESGEYAIPQMMGTLLDPAKSKAWPRVVRALPRIGKSAVNPLAMSLRVNREDVRQHVIAALGEIGYVQAIPYLRALQADSNATPETKSQIDVAIARIEAVSGRSMTGSTEQMFLQLGENYFDEIEEVRADPRLPEANVWYWDAESQSLQRVVVPTPIFGGVMAMRCAEEALKAKNDHAESIALWLAANTRREARLGMNTESGDPAETPKDLRDATRPEGFPRALYFTQAAGPRYAHAVLDRAVRDRDAAVALGAIAALDETAGESSLIGSEDYKQPLVSALKFPDVLVRVRAALALGAALPKTPFAGSQHVVPTLSSALAQTGKDYVLVVDGDEASRNRVVGALRGDGREVIGEAGLLRGLDRARTEFPVLSALFVASDARDPDLRGAMGALRGEFIFSRTPVVILKRSGDDLLVESVTGADGDSAAVRADAAGDDLAGTLARLREKSGSRALDEKLAMDIALEAGETLRRIAVDGRTAFDITQAEPALISALGSPHEPLRVLAASVLALAPSSTAQRSIAQTALDEGNEVGLRIAALEALSASAKAHGNMLEPGQITSLIRLASAEQDLVLRTAASRTLGSLNLANNQASEIIRSFYGG